MAKHLLVVDDQESMLTIISRLLRESGFEVTTALDAEQGLKLYNENPLNFDLIVSDVNLPKIDGFEFLKRVRAIDPDQPMIFISGLHEEVVKMGGEADRINGVIGKPFQLETALQTINRVLNI